jgi:hypothetical protein
VWRRISAISMPLGWHPQAAHWFDVCIHGFVCLLWQGDRDVRLH